MARHSILHNTLLLTTANLLMRTVSMLFRVYLSNLIGPSGIGLLQLVLTVGGLALTVGTSGVRVSAMYLTAEEHGHRRRAGVRAAMRACIALGLLISSMAGIALFALSPMIAERWLLDLRATASLRLLALSLPISCLSGVMSGYFTACGKIRKLVLIELLEQAVAMILTVALLRYWANGELGRVCCSVIAGSVGSTFLSLAALLLIFFRDLGSMQGRETDLHMTKRLFRLCVPLALNDYLRAGLSTLEQFLIPRGLSKSGSSYETSLAAYGTIHGMVFPVLMFPAALFYSLSDLLVPELSRHRAQGHHARIAGITASCLRMGILFSCTIAGLMFVLAPALGQIIYQSYAAGRYLRLFAPQILILYMDALVDGMHKGLGQQVHCVRYNTITSLMDVVLLILLLPRFGLSGYYFSFTITHAVNFYLSIARLIKVTDYAPTIRSTLSTLVCACLSTAAVSLFVPSSPDYAGLLSAGCAFVLIFLPLGLLAGVLETGDLQLFLPWKPGRKATRQSITISHTVKTPSATRNRTSLPANANPYRRVGSS